MIICLFVPLQHNWILCTPD